jgi:hypothetical protein
MDFESLFRLGDGAFFRRLPNNCDEAIVEAYRATEAVDIFSEVV